MGRNAAYALAAQLTTSIFTAGLTLYLVRALGPVGYGTFALAVSIAGILVLPADFGISQSTGRFVAERLESPRAVGAVLAMAVRIKLLLGAAVAGLLIALAGPIAAAYGAPELVWPLRGVGFALFGQSVMQLAQTIFIATRQMSRNLALVASESMMELSASVALVLLGAGAGGAAFGRAAGYLVGAILGLAVLARLTGISIWRPGPDSPVSSRQFVGYAGALLIIDGTFALFNQIDILIIGGLLGTAAAGVFSAPVRLLAFIGYPGLSVAQAVAPRLAGLGLSQPGEVRRLGQALRLLIVVQLMIAVFAAVWAEPIIDLLLGDQYKGSVEVFRAITPFIFLIGLGPLVTLTLNYAGHARRRVPIALTAVAINAGFDFAFVPSMGIVAGSVGTDLAYGLFVGWHLYLCRSILGLALGPLSMTLVRSAIAMLPMIALLLGLQSDGLVLWEWALGLIAGPSLTAAMLVLVGETSVSELKRLSRPPLDLLRR